MLIQTEIELGNFFNLRLYLLSNTLFLFQQEAVFYFRSNNNPGYWFLQALQCHIEVHQLEGMAVAINEAPGNHNPPLVGMDSCRGSFNLQIGMLKC